MLDMNLITVIQESIENSNIFPFLCSIGLGLGLFIFLRITDYLEWGEKDLPIEESGQPKKKKKSKKPKRTKRIYKDKNNRKSKRLKTKKRS